MKIDEWEKEVRDCVNKTDNCSAGKPWCGDLRDCSTCTGFKQMIRGYKEALKEIEKEKLINKKIVEKP